jgi:predicted aspartyl protease
VTRLPALALLMLAGCDVAAEPQPRARRDAAPTVAPTPTVTLLPDAEARWVEFDLTPGNQIRFDMQVDGRTASAILDTGVSLTVASRRFASLAELRSLSTSNARAQAIGGQVPLGWANTDRLAIGGLQRRGGRVAIIDLTAIATGSERAVDLLVGADILSCCALDIDYDTRRFRLIPSGRLPFRGQSVPLSLAAQTRVFVSEATVGGRRLKPLIVDTGDGSALTLARGAWSSTGIRPPALTSSVAFGLGGPIETDVAILPRIAIGAQDVRDVEVRIEPKNGFSDQTGTAGRIGSGLLQRYRVLLDPRAGHMIFQPGARAETAQPRSTSGLLVGHNEGRLRVLHVMRGSPAQQGGWRAGDLICAVDGDAVPRATSGSIDTAWSAGAPGRTVRLDLCDGTSRALTLRRFY